MNPAITSDSPRGGQGVIDQRDRYLAVIGIGEPVDVTRILGRDPDRIAVVCTHRLGDTLATLPTIGALRHTFPAASVTMIAATELETLLRPQSGVADFRTLAANDIGIEEQTRDFDLVLLFRSWPGPAIPEDYPLWFSVSTDVLLGRQKFAHVHYLETLALLGISGPAGRPHIEVPQTAVQFADEFMSGFDGASRPVVALHPGSYYEGKRWPADRFASVLRWLADCYDARFVMVEGHRERELVQEVTAGLGDRALRLAHESLPNVAAVLARCTFYIGNDTGIMHLADAVDTPSLTVFGPSRPGVWGASSPQAVWLVQEDLWHACTACSDRHLKDKPCKRPDEQVCLQSIRVDDVCGAIESLAALIGLRQRYDHLDGIHSSRHLLRVPFDEDGLMLVNLQAMRPLHIARGRQMVEACIEHVAQNGSYHGAVGAGHESDLLGALLTYRILLPHGDADEALVGDEEQRRRLMGHRLVWEMAGSGTTDDVGKGAPTAVQCATGRQSEDRLRILFVNSIEHHTYGGGERWMLNVGSALAERGHLVICWGLQGHRWIADAERLGLLSLSAPVPLLLDYRTIHDTVEYIRRLAIDAVVLNMDREIVSLALPLKLAGVPLVYARKGLPSKELTAAALWSANRLLDGIITPARSTRDEMLALGALDEGRMHVVPNAVDISRFSRPVSGLDTFRRDLKLERSHKVILTIGRLVEHKGTIDLIRGFDLARQRLEDLRLVIVGRGPALRDLKAEIASRDLAEHVRLLGERWDVERLLALADCFVLPSHYEGLSTAMLEAMAAGVPVVATAVSGAPEVITDGETGLLIPLADPVAIANAIFAALEDGRASPMADRARAYVAEHHDFPTLVDEIERLLTPTGAATDTEVA